MDVQVQIGQNKFTANLNKPLDISLAVMRSGVKAWYVNEPEIEPERGEGFVGSVAEGGSVNFFHLFFHPHGHGTHTECIGHITPQKESINQIASNFHSVAQLVTVAPAKVGEDTVVQKSQLEKVSWENTEAAIIRTLPNKPEKKTVNYSNTNPTYFEAAALEFLREKGIKHLLVDTPSVDRENDEGKMLAHKAFWNFDELNKTGNDNTITELIYVNESIADGLYLLNLQVAAIENDAAPSRPLLYNLIANN